MIMGKIIQIEVPEDIWILLQKEEQLKQNLQELFIKEIKEYLLTIYALDELTKDSNLTEEDIMKIDKEIKKNIMEKWKNESNR